jgi:hypothetical protein
MSGIISTITTGISTFKSIAGKVESVLHLFGVLDDDMVLLDLLEPALNILIDDMHDEIIDGISYYYFM